MAICKSWGDTYERFVDYDDNVLCIGMQIPAEAVASRAKSLSKIEEGVTAASLANNIDTVANCDSIPNKKYSIIFGESQLSGTYRLKDHFSKINDHITNSRQTNCGYYVLVEPIVGKEDARLNALLSFLDPFHIRTYRVNEIISSAASELFELMSFRKWSFSKRLSLPTDSTLKIVEEQLRALPERFVDYYFCPEYYQFYRGAECAADKISCALSEKKLVLNVGFGLFWWYSRDIR